MDTALPPAPLFSSFFGQSLVSFDVASQDEIKKIIIDSSTKHCDLDPIPTALLKTCIDDVLPCITHIINDSLTSGVVPACYKDALVKPLLKKPGLDHNILKNFRPVSNLPFLSKILEKVVLKRLISHLNNNNLNEVFQSAYKKYHSMETALLRVFNDILSDLDNRNVTLLALLDLSAAFDTLDHSILLKRLEMSFGIKGSALSWFESYLVSRSQSVQINKTISDSETLIYGVPQGSVLGPILFTLYTTPLSDIFCKYKMNYHLYADDSQLYTSSNFLDLDNHLRQTELCIEDTKSFMDSNKLKLNNDKTELIIFKNKFQTKDHVNVTLNINECDITSSSHVKNLGVIFDEDLSMTTHVNSVYKSIIFQLSKISHIRKYISVEVAKTLVTSLILSRLDYCNSLFCNMSNENIEKMQLLQNHAARLIFRVKKKDHVTPLLFKLHWLPIKFRIDYKIALLCYKCLNNAAPIYLQNLVEVYVPRRELRSSADNSKLLKPVMNYKSYGEKSFSYYGPTVWNSLPFNLRNIDNLNTFKTHLKTYFFKQAYNL